MNFAKSVIAVFVAQALIVILFFAAAAVVGIVASARGSADVKEGAWLVIDIYGDIPPYDPPETIGLGLFESKPETLHRILGNLEKAVVDTRIAGVIMKVSSSNSLGRAGVQEIREAIRLVQEAGKPVYAFSDGLDRRSLYLASACDSIFMPDIGVVTLLGMAVVREYYRGTFDKLDIKPQLHRIKDYKSAAETYTRTDMSPETREMVNWMLDEFWDMEVGAIAEDRNIPLAKLEEHMQYALFLASEAKEAGLIDDLSYWDDLTERLKGEEDKKLRTISQRAYAEVSRKEAGIDGNKRFAVIHAYGMIGGRKTRINPMFGPMIGHETLAGQIRSAADNDKIDAIILRLDSGGGESLASHLIAREVARTRAKKPIIISMIDAAASGGYAISYKATRIVADPLTITGSIGSIYGKLNMKGLYNKVGLSYDWVSKGPNSLLWSPITDFSPAQWDRFVEHHYNSFNIWLEDVAEERGYSMEELDNLAQGRVWSGRQALENGLIDELGGLTRAIEIAKIEAGVPVDEDVILDHYPKEKGLLTLLFSEDGPLGIVNWFAYRFLHEEIAGTIRILMNADLMMEPMEIR
ncbi:MAG: signal peptide peptidase SppA [Candidatus Krumholzibacteriota bacterium]|nr:signal peptide peptidase SppA [Candidatus Krumholzibacteriota bacterium]